MAINKTQPDNALPNGVWTGGIRHLIRNICWRLLAPLPDRAFCSAKYLTIYGRLPALHKPTRFSEWVQYRKLDDRNPLFPILVDKAACKTYLIDRVGTSLVIPTIWVGTALKTVNWTAVPLPVVVKPTHASGVGLLLRTDQDVAALLASDPSSRWIAIDHSRFNREWAYRAVPPRIIIEPALLGDDGGLPSDYRVFVFGGAVSHIEVEATIGGIRRYDFYTPDWTKLDLEDPDAAGHFEGTLPQPYRLAELLTAAVRIAGQLDFARVDFLVTGERLFVGEVTIYPGGGFDRFKPDAFDFILGQRWETAVTARDNATSLGSDRPELDLDYLRRHADPNRQPRAAEATRHDEMAAVFDDMSVAEAMAKRRRD